MTWLLTVNLSRTYALLSLRFFLFKKKEGSLWPKFLCLRTGGLPGSNPESAAGREAEASPSKETQTDEGVCSKLATRQRFLKRRVEVESEEQGHVRHNPQGTPRPAP